MWYPKSGTRFYKGGGGGGGGGGGDRLQQKGTAIVAVAIDKDKNSQFALKWAVEHLLTRGQTIVLIHVIKKTSSTGNYQIRKMNKRPRLIFCHCECSRGRGLNARLLCGELSESDTDISFVSSGRPSSDRMSNFSSINSGLTPRFSTSSDIMGSPYFGTKASDTKSMQELSSSFDPSSHHVVTLTTISKPVKMRTTIIWTKPHFALPTSRKL